MIRRYLKLFVLTLAVATAARAGTPWTITPGTGVGNITLGMDAGVPDKYLSKPQGIGLNSGLMAYIYSEEGLELQTEKRKIVAIVVTKRSATVHGQAIDYVANGGVSVGSSVNQMETTFGKNYEAKATGPQIGNRAASDMFYAYRSLGVGFQCHAGSIAAIHIYAAK